MTIAYDAVSSLSFTGDVTAGLWVHTPVGTPKAVIVLVGMNTSLVDQIASVSYGGVAMTEVSLSPLLGSAGDEDGMVYGYFLGSGIPTGAQDILVDTTSTAGKRGVAITCTAAADTAVDTTNTLDAVQANPSLVLATTASTATFIAAMLHTGLNAVGDFDKGADYTQLYENDLGTVCVGAQYRTTNGAGGNITVDWVAAGSDDAHVLAVAIKEAAAAAASKVPVHRYVKSQAVQRASRW